MIPLGRRTLILRFGSIGDFVSAVSFCNSRQEYDLFFAGQLYGFIWGRHKDYAQMKQFTPISDSTNVHFGNIFELVNILKIGTYNRILIYSQSAKGLKLQLIALFLKALSYTFFKNSITVKKFFFGGQYFHLINNNSQIKSIVKTLAKGARISIFFDSKEPANNLNAATISLINSILVDALHNPVISLYGSTRLNLGKDCDLHNLSGQTSLDDISCVFQETDLAITCDAGPLHVLSTLGIPCITFMSARQEILNWAPPTSKNYYIFDDRIDCLGCQKAVCPRGENLCVNSEVTRAIFHEIFR